MSGGYSLFYKKTDNLLYESVYSAVISVLIVGGLITMFFLFTQALLRLELLTPVINLLDKILGKNLGKGFVLGVFECTRGIKTIAENGITILALPLCAFLSGFGGLCIITQSIAYLKKAKIKTTYFILSKIVSAVLNFIFGLIISFIFL